MSSFDDREKGFEAKYKLDKEQAFKAQARRNKLLGLWAAPMLGIEGDAAEAYARDVVSADFDEPGDDDVLRKVLADFESKGVGMDRETLRKKMDELLGVAAEQVKQEG